MLKRPHYIALGLVAVLTVILLNLPTRTAARVKLAVGSVFLPLFGLSRTTENLADKAAAALTPRAELVKQNEELKRANQELQLRLNQAEAIARENDQLRSLVGWQRQQRRNFKLANVVMRDPANWWQSVWIDVGSRDAGIRADLPVMTTSGLVGRIAVVRPTHCLVELITSPACKVSALVDQTRESGVIAGSSSPVDNTMVTLSFLSSNSSLKPGQAVVTSGLGGIFPPGIPIGQVAENSRPVDFGLYTEARVKLAANLGALEKVWVLLP